MQIRHSCTFFPIRLLLHQRLFHLDENRTIRQVPLGIYQIDEPIPLSQTVQPYARPSRKIISPQLIISHREAHKRQLLD